MPDDALEILRRSAFFAAWSSGDLGDLAQSSLRRTCQRGEVLAARGQPFPYVALILEGQIDARSDDGGDGLAGVLLESFHAGDLAADELFAKSERNPRALIAPARTSMLTMPNKTFVSWLSPRPAAALALARDLELRLMRAKEVVASFAMARVETRLRHALVTLAGDQGERVPKGVVIRNSPTRQDLGRMIGACRETVSRIVSDLTRRGLVVSRHRELMLTSEFLAAADGRRTSRLGVP